MTGFVRDGLDRFEAMLDTLFGPAANPMHQLGALGFLFYWVIAVSGVYIYILFDTGTTEAYESVQAMTVEQWYLGGVMRSLHRYASDALVLVMILHIGREFVRGRFRGPGWFTWVTGTPILWFVMIAGISGYWLVWDELAQFIAVISAEWLDWLGIFGQSIARNFLTPAALDDRFFTLLTFVHIVVPLLLLLVLWLHLQRLARPRINANRGLLAGTLLMLIALSFAKPATSHAPADLGKVSGTLDLDWYYLAFYPLIDRLPAGATWGFAVALTVLLAVVPWLPPRRRAPAAVVHLDNCNGCSRCVDDCPYNAVLMVPRTDGKPFAQQARVDPALCVGCGICAGACPTAMPFRRRSALEPGIELPDQTVASLRERLDAALAALTGPSRVVVFACAQSAAAHTEFGTDTAVIDAPCVGAVPPAFIDYALSRGRADGVVMAGCAEGRCHFRHGLAWTAARLNRTRDPHLRRRVPTERLTVIHAARGDARGCRHALERFRAGVSSDGDRHG